MTDQERFDNILVDILNESSASTLLSIPGIYEILSEYFNNDILDFMHDEDEGLA
jgi:hypothetical protein